MERGREVAVSSGSSLSPHPCLPHTHLQVHVNINGFLEGGRDRELQFTVGNEVRGLQ